ncbi:MAG: long-chain fatty acid--CoA ligase [Deltaproteobacteria bacterium]|nr:long-chain fatty acid--CoA ligase [Deltaproteobacteria bacterium]
MEPHATLADLLETAATRRPAATALRTLRGGVETRETVAGLRRIARSWACGLVAMGVAPGDRVAIIAETRMEWLVADAAVLLAGAVSVPIDTFATRSDIAFMLDDSGVKIAFAAGPFELERLLAGCAERGGGEDGAACLEKVIVFEAEQQRERPDRKGRRRLLLAEVVDPEGGRVLSPAALAEQGRTVADAELERRRATLPSDAIATLVYTAGTTGRPKGTLLSHKALLHQVAALDEALGLRADDCILLGLPLAYAFARIVAWVAVGRGIELAMPQRGLFGAGELQRLQPSIVPAVPRQLEALAHDLERSIHGFGKVRRRLLDWAVGVGIESSQVRLQGGQTQGLLGLRGLVADRLVHRRLHDAVGGRVRMLISGGAPLSRDLAEWYHAVGFELLEGYGLTETCACATLNRPGEARLGTVGKPLRGVELRIAEDGEVLVRGPNLMSGYHGAEQATRDALDDDGWLHSGDIGELDSHGYLRITDRKKDILLTASGKAVAPQNVESHLEASDFVDSALVYGDGKPYLTALLILDESAIKRFCAERDIAYTSFAEISQHPAIYRLIERVIEERNRSLASYETVKKFAILDRQLSVEDGDLTPTLKLRRQALIRKYGRLLGSFYEEGF